MNLQDIREPDALDEVAGSTSSKNKKGKKRKPRAPSNKADKEIQSAIIETTELPSDIASRREETSSSEGHSTAGHTDQASVSDKDTGLTPTEMLGQVLWLMMRSPAHKHFFLSDFEWLVMPPIQLKQIRMYHKDGVPFAYCSWAYVNEDAEKRLADGARRLSPLEWNNGDRLWLIDLVAPFGGAEIIANDLKEVFPDRTLKSLRPKKEGTGFEVIELT